MNNSYFLSWHGALLSYKNGSFYFRSVFSNPIEATDLLTIDSEGNLTPSVPFMKVITHRDEEGPSFSLKSQGQFLSSRNESEVGLTPHCYGWEKFFAVGLESLQVFQKMLTGFWLCEDQVMGKVTYHEGSLVLGERKWLVAEHVFSQTKGGITISSLSSQKQVFLKPYPSEDLNALLIRLHNRLLLGDSSREKRIWANFHTLQEDAVCLMVNPTEVRNLVSLIAACLLCDLWEMARDFFLWGISHFHQPELYFCGSFIFSQQSDYENAAHYFSRLIRAVVPAEETPSNDLMEILNGFKAGNSVLFKHFFTLVDQYFLPYKNLFYRLCLPWDVTSKPFDAYSLQLYSDRFEAERIYLPRQQQQIFVDEDVKLNGLRSWNQIVAGHVAWLNGNRREADTHYRVAKSKAMEESIIPVHYNSGVYTWLSEEECETLVEKQTADQFGVSAWQWVSSHLSHPTSHDKADELTTERDEAGLCLVVGCDGRYFRYIPKLLLSLLKACQGSYTGGRIRLCLGIVSPTDDHLAFLHTIVESLSAHDYGMDFTFTYGSLVYMDGATYTAIRYLMLPKVVEQYHTRVITADCDAIFPENFLTLWEEMKASTDYGFRLYAYDKMGHQLMGEPWGFGAGISYFGYLPDLLDIARFLYHYLQRAYDPKNPTNWCVDQCALAQAFHRFIHPRWREWRIKFMNEGEPLMIMPHHVGGKSNLLGLGGTTAMKDVLDYLKIRDRS